MKLTNLKDLYIHQLKDLYSAEKQVVEALPKMIEAATADKLKEAFRDHLAESEQHLKKVQKLLDELDANPTNTKCKAMEGLIKEGEDAIDIEGSLEVRDAALIAAAQRVEHYEIAGYGTVREYAKELGYTDAYSVLAGIMDEEGDADERLNQIAAGGLLRQGLNELAQA